MGSKIIVTQGVYAVGLCVCGGGGWRGYLGEDRSRGDCCLSVGVRV